MKAGIHPEYAELAATCTCGNVIKVNSTVGKNLHLDVCGACHPFYTGTQKVMDSGGRIDKFNKRLQLLRRARGKPRGLAVITGVTGGNLADVEAKRGSHDT